MKYLVNAREMREIDAYTIEEIGIPSMVLMERAAFAVALEVKKRAVSALPVLFVCGCGNNGADGLAAARILKEFGIETRVYFPVISGHVTEEWKKQKQILEKLSIPIINDPDFSEYTVLIDAIFGVGLSREVTGDYKICIKKMNQSEIPILSIDIPSGLDSTTGKVLGICIEAKWTVTFGFLKLGLLLYPGADFAGKIIEREIGFPKEAVEQVKPNAFFYEECDLTQIPARKPYSNKGTYGKIAIVAGSKNMAGAAYLAARAAYATGAGLVKIITCEENRMILQTKLPEAILATYHQKNWKEVLEKALEWADVIVAGPGLGTKEIAVCIVECILSYAAIQKEKSVIFDADALNILSKNKENLHFLKENGIITPHMGEMARLTGNTINQIQDSFVETAANFSSKYGLICVLKDARTIVSSGLEEPFYVNVSGNNGMAAGGAGDVLTGIIAGLCAMKLSNRRAAELGVYIHGLAGDEAKKEKGSYAMGARDIIKGLRKVFAKLEKKE